MSDEVARSAEMPSSSHNPMLERFYKPDLQDDRQITGLLAYALYKVAKREWATQIWNENGRAPTPEEATTYTRTWTPSLLRSTIAEAEAALAAYADTVIEEATPRIREEAIRGTRSDAIVTGLITAVIYTALLIGFALILEVAGVDLVEIAGRVHMLVHSDRPPNPAPSVLLK